MHVSLDHYRILGVTPEASALYLQQAYQALLGWVPHREFSELALLARRRILERSFAVLSDPEQRRDYDHALEEGERELVVAPEDGIGALILLFSLGEYQAVLDLAQPQPEEDDLIRSDRILVRALSCQQLGLLLWQQGNFATAGDILETAQVELMEAGLFLHLRGELQAYLFKLRPDRVLDLLRTAREFPQRLGQGLTLLKEMLHERGGIEGKGNDYSGLDTGQFLHFIQEIRQYLPTHTQEQLFAEEAKRPSLVASFLHAYCLVAMGFHQFRPDYIRQAKGIFIKLRPDQNIYLESSLCSLLLGQTEIALSEIILSPEYDTILKLDPGPESDLLANLCWYCEHRWLEQEIYPHFADLIDQLPSLKTYFAEKQVETYLDDLLTKPHTSEWVPSSLPRPTAPPPTELAEAWKLPTPPKEPIAMTKPPMHRPRSGFPKLLLILIVAFLGLGGGAGFWFLKSRGILPRVGQQESLVLIQRPVFASFAQVALLRVPEEIDQTQAAQIITQWQNTKALAMGEKYETKALETILLEPSLSEWRQRSAQNQAEQSYLVYTTKGVEIKSVAKEGKDKAEVVALISEDRDFIYQGERVAEFSRSGAKYEVTYRLVRQNDNWFIQDMIVID